MLLIPDHRNTFWTQIVPIFVFSDVNWPHLQAYWFPVYHRSGRTQTEFSEYLQVHCSAHHLKPEHGTQCGEPVCV